MTQKSHFKRTSISPQIMVDTRKQQVNIHLRRDSFEEAFTDTDNTEWEDEEEPQQEYERRSQTSSSLRSSARRRSRAITQSQHARRRTRQASQKPVPDPAPEYPPIISRQEVLHGALGTAVSTLQYMWGIARIAFRLAHIPLAVLATLLLLTFIMGRITNTIRDAISPLCVVPGLSSSAWCRPIDSTSTQGAQWADFPKLMEVQSKTFENIMMESIGTPILSLDIKNAEMATKDLVVVVKHSDLKAKDSVVSMLTGFLVDAKRTGEGLGKLASRVGGAVDSIMAANDYAINSIEAARASQPTAWSIGAVVPWMKPKKPKKSLDEVVTKTFDDAMNHLSQQMERLILEASVNLQNLNRLEEHLMVLHDVVHREDSSISTARNELLADLWTHLGWNRDKMRNFDKNLNILKDLRLYREEAKSRIVATLHILQSMQHDMEEMRERVAEPDLLGSSIPAEVHMKSISIGLERLKEGRVKSQQLEAERRRRFALAQGFEV